MYPCGCVGKGTQRGGKPEQGRGGARSPMVVAAPPGREKRQEGKKRGKKEIATLPLTHARTTGLHSASPTTIALIHRRVHTARQTRSAKKNTEWMRSAAKAKCA